MNTKVWAIVAALALLVGAVVLVVVLTGDDGKTAVAGEPTSTGSTPTDGPTAQPAPDDVDPDDPAFAAAESEPLEDSLYPNVGDPGVDALHYDLDIAWDAGVGDAHRHHHAGLPGHRRRAGVPARPRRAARGGVG